ncbi:MAG TPA: insulinase family protein [Kofleriaceae bacterium]|nr:insulinase family protein [Kofleriaceae bacterium]
MTNRLLALALVATTTTCGPAAKPAPVTPPPTTADVAASATPPAPASTPPPAPPPPRAKAIAAPALVPTPLADDATRTTIHRLSNGMTVYLSPDPQEPSVIAHVAVHAGSSFDPERSTGLAHYLEHMLFKGTTQLGTLDYAQEQPHLEHIARLYDELRKPAADRDQILRAIDRETQADAAFAVPNELDQLYSRLGITGLNAFTNNDATVYIAKVPKNRLAQWARVEATRYADAVFRLFWPELEAVYEEKNRGLDSPPRQVHEAFMKLMFPHHGYGWSSTLGEVEHLKNPAYADMQAFFQRYYTPQNMAILLSGDVDDSVLPMLEQAFAGFQRPAGEAAPPGAPPELTGRVQVDVPVPANEGILLGWPLVAATHPDRSAIEVMDRIVLDGASGIMSRELILPQKVATAGSNPTFLREAGYFEMYADALAGQSHAELERLLHGIVDKLQRGEFSDDEVAAAILTIDIERQRAIESNAGRMVLMEQAFINGEDWADVAHRVERIKAVTKADIVRVARRYLTGDYLIVRKVKGVANLPKITKPSITAVAVDPARRGAYAQSILDLPVAPIEPVAVAAGRDYQRKAIATGPLVTVANARNGLFTVRYDYDVGRTDDRFVCLALDVLRLAGAGERSADELARQLHQLGVAVGSTCSRLETSIFISGLDRNLDPAMALIRDWLAHPAFDGATVVARVATVKTERANAIANPQVVASAQQDYARYGKDTEFLVVPSNAELDRVTPAQIQATLAGFLHWKHRTSYYGPRSAAQAAAAVVLGDGTRATAPRPPVRLRAPNTALVTDQPTAQTHVYLIWPRGRATAAERAAGTMFTEYIRPVLFQEVREARGLAYTVTGSYAPGAKQADDAQLMAYVGTQRDKAHDALDAVLATLRAPIDDKRFAQARGTLAETYRAERIAPRDLAAAVYRWEDQGERGDPRAARYARASRVDRDALDRWRTAALARPVILSVVGDHARLDDARLSVLAPITMVPVTKLFGY